MFLPDAFPLITDPYFYGVTVPAVLLLGISKSGFGAGYFDAGLAADGPAGYGRVSQRL